MKKEKYIIKYLRFLEHYFKEFIYIFFMREFYILTIIFYYC